MRQSCWPDVEMIDTHPLVDEPHGPIYVLKGAQNEKWMQKNLEFSAGSKAPRGGKKGAMKAGKYG
jgi:hypothetical protein